VDNSLGVAVKAVVNDFKEENIRKKHTSNNHLIQEWSMDSILPEKYNKLIPPAPKKGEPVRVQINLNITQILAVKEDEQVKKGCKTRCFSR
jgi:hypothetical protein